MRYYSVYLITNTINYNTYVGVHVTDDLNDSYFGSGKALKSAISKYGKENFLREILFVYDNPEDMFAKEKELVSEECVRDPNTYNIRVGGLGGFDHINRDPELSIKCSNRMLGNTFRRGRKFGPNKSYATPPGISERMSLVHKGKPKSDEQRERMSFARKNQIRKTCPHCGLEGCSSQMTRYHFDNCKRKTATK